MTSAVELRADCTRCAALCCMAPAFDKSPSFALDKPAQTPCPNLDETGACMIHENLGQRGFGGCAAYDCHGAGQRVTQELFGGRSWREEPKLTGPMSRAFMALRQIHELLAMLEAAKKLPLDTTERQLLSDLSAALHPADGWSEETLAAAPVDELVMRTNEFLRTLKRHIDIAEIGNL